MSRETGLEMAFVAVLGWVTAGAGASSLASGRYFVAGVLLWIAAHSLMRLFAHYRSV